MEYFLPDLILTPVAASTCLRASRTTGQRRVCVIVSTGRPVNVASSSSEAEPDSDASVEPVSEKKVPAPICRAERLSAKDSKAGSQLIKGFFPSATSLPGRSTTSRANGKRRPRPRGFPVSGACSPTSDTWTCSDRGGSDSGCEAARPHELQRGSLDASPVKGKVPEARSRPKDWLSGESLNGHGSPPHAPTGANRGPTAL